MDKSIVFLTDDFGEKLVLETAAMGARKIYLHANPFKTTVKEFIDFRIKNQKLIDKLEKGGIAVEYQLHAVSYLLPRVLFKNKPELFLSDENGCKNSAFNCCPSSGEALKNIEEKAEKLAFLLKQKTSRYHLWADDDLGADIRCRCEKCKDLSAFRQNSIICEAITRGIKKYDEKAENALLLYGEEPEFRDAPKNAFIEFAPFKREHAIPLTKGKKNAFFADKLKNLISVYRADKVSVLEYFLSFDFNGFLRGDGASRVEKDVEFYINAGVTNLTTFAVFASASTEEKLDGIKKYFKILG